MPRVAEDDGPQEVNSTWLGFLRYPGRWLFGFGVFVVVAGGLVVGYRSWSVGRAIAQIEANGGRVGTFFFEYWGLRRQAIGLQGWGDWYSVTFSSSDFADDDFAALISKLKSLEDVVWLQFENTSISDSSMPAICSLQGITDLELQNTRITDAGLPALSQLPILRRLDLSGTGITDAGLPAIARCVELEDLVLKGCPVTDASLQDLLAIVKLTSLDLTDTKISETAISELRAKRPSLRLILE